MVKYVNSFSCVMNNESKQFLIDFAQNFPELSESGFNSSKLVMESVATIAMDLELAENLYQVLKKTFDVSSEEE